MFALLISYKTNDVVFGQKSQIENVSRRTRTNPMGIREYCPLFQCRWWGKRSDGIAPTARMVLMIHQCSEITAL